MLGVFIIINEKCFIFSILYNILGQGGQSGQDGAGVGGLGGNNGGGASSVSLSSAALVNGGSSGKI